MNEENCPECGLLKDRKMGFRGIVCPECNKIMKPLETNLEVIEEALKGS